jgi:hypothetical protein
MKWAISLFVYSCCLFSEVPGILAIRNARVVTAAGPALAKGTVVVRDGLIESVGADAAVPAEAWVIEGAGLTVYPGLIDSLSTWGIPTAAPQSGIGGGARGGARPVVVTPGTPAPPQTAEPPARGPEDRPQNTSWLHAQDLVRTSDRSIVSARNAGFTTAVTYPTNGIFGGQGAAINLGGNKPGEMLVAGPTALYLSLGPRGFGGGGGGGFPGSLMGVIAYIRQVYLDAEHYKMAKAAYAANPRGMRRPDYDRALEGVLEAPRILLPAERLVEVDRMLRFAAELKQQAILYGGHELYRSADLLKKSGTPVLVNLRWPERDRDADPELTEPLRVLELREKAPSAPAVLAKAGVKFAFYSGAVERPADLRRAVKRAVDSGLSIDDAVRALTLSAAEIYGMADRIGSIEKGKIANLVVTDGDLFADATKIKYVIVDGVKYEPAVETPDSAGERTENE